MREEQPTEATRLDYILWRVVSKLAKSRRDGRNVVSIKPAERLAGREASQSVVVPITVCTEPDKPADKGPHYKGN